ncbi:MAG: PTS sugar transporter subunit IIA [Clostridiales bacterium]|uniref:BglG family transcription antiterminator n=1 Tax=Clostridium sp. 2218st1_F5_2218SCRN_220325 TaxID=3143056 RepID=UPI0025D5899F|nr:PTS sugar transporter subunit IIA [uncultured Intestinibacter sp.]MDU1203624.1 PTS sugar transporter subunit IIA [Clostridiales bacterium]
MIIYSVRALNIIEILKNSHDPVSSLALSEEIGCSTKTIQSEIKDINKNGKDGKIISIRGIGYKIEGSFDDIAIPSQYLGNVDRIDYIIKNLINLTTKPENTVKLEELADSMYISVSTVKNDLKEVKSILKKYNISVVSKHKQGIAIQASEDDITSFILDICSKKDNELNLKDFLSEKVSNNIFNLKNIILNMLGREHLVLSDTEFKNLCSIIFIKLSRSNQDESEFIQAYIKDYIIQRELIMNDDKNKEKIIRAIKKFCKNLKIATSIDLSQDEIFETCLYNHINSIYKKMKLGINQYGVLPIDIRIKYPYAYELGKIAKKTIEEELGLKLDDEEISNIAVHVGGAIERSEHNQKKKVFKVIIVCVSGIGTSMLVKNKLEYLFEGKIEIVKIIPAYLIDYINVMEVDFIISTVDIKCERVPVITVSPLLNDNEVKIIEKFMKTGKMYKEVETRDLFDRNLFFTDLDFNTKEEVIEYMGSQLVNQGVIDDEMKKSFFDREKIATTEIGHMVALPHGANGKILKNKIAVGILKNPIHWTLDDVRLVLILAIDKDEIFDYEKLFSTIYKQVGSVSKVIGICENKSYEKFMKMF